MAFRRLLLKAFSPNINSQVNRPARFFELVLFRALANLKAEVSRYYLNFLWWVIEPLLTMGVFYVVFGVLLQRGSGSEFVFFLLSGIVAWNWFNRTINNSSDSVIRGRNLYINIPLDKMFFPLEICIRDSFKQILVLIILITLLLFNNYLSLTWLALPAVVFVEFVFIIGVSFFVASVVPLLPDLKFIVQTGLMLLFFGSGIFFDLESMPVLESHKSLFYLNPMAGIIKNMRLVLIEASWPEWAYLINVMVVGVVLMLAARVISTIMEPYYTKVG